MLALNSETNKSAGLDGLYLHTDHLGPGRALPAPGYELVERLGVSGSLDKHTAIGLIFHQAGEAQFHRFFFGTLAIENTLHFTSNNNGNSL